MDDGKITTDELRSIGRGWFGGFSRGFGQASAETASRAPNASPAPSASPAAGG